MGWVFLCFVLLSVSILLYFFYYLVCYFFSSLSLQ